MGYIRHHAILVTGADYPQAQEWLQAAHRLAIAAGCDVSPISRPTMNGYQSFTVFPDGSKEGWIESDAGDARRHAFLEWMDKARHEDGSTGVKWVEVQYGDDEGVTRIVRHSEQERDRPYDPPSTAA